jgi:hypothetical protein
MSYYISYKAMTKTEELIRNLKNTVDRLLVLRPLCVAVVFGLFFAVSFFRLDPDFGWHLQTGRYIWAHGIPMHDIYTYTARTYRWIDHEWGNDVIQALIYRAGGYLLSSLFFAAIWTGALLIFGWRSKPWLMVIAAIGILPYAGIRPVAWSVLFFAIVLAIVRTKNKRWLVVLPLLFLFWANLHAGFIAGLALLLYFAVLKKDLKVALALIISLAMTFINPYGYRLYLEIGRTIFDPTLHKEIVEWGRFLVPTQTWAYVTLWAAGFLFYARKNIRRWIEPGPILLAATLSSSRNFPLFVVATVGETDLYLHALRTKLPKPNKAAKLLLVIAAVLFSIAILYSVYAEFQPYSRRYYDYPVKAVAYLKQHQCPGNLFNDYNYGGYLIWKLPKQPVFIDGRMVTWTYYMNEYLAVVQHPKTYQATFAKYRIDCALLNNQRESGLLKILKADEWKSIINNNDSTLLVKA